MMRIASAMVGWWRRGLVERPLPRGDVSLLYFWGSQGGATFLTLPLMGLLGGIAIDRERAFEGIVLDTLTERALSESGVIGILAAFLTAWAAGFAWGTYHFLQSRRIAVQVYLVRGYVLLIWAWHVIVLTTIVVSGRFLDAWGSGYYAGTFSLLGLIVVAATWGIRLPDGSRLGPPAEDH